MNYTLVSGFFHRPGDAWARWFFPLWLENIYRYANPVPRQIIVIASAGCEVPRKFKWSVWKKQIQLDVVRLKGDLGHCDSLLNGTNPWFMPACPTVWMAGAMLCYSNVTDMVYIEQDCLAFGPWVQRAYKDIEDKGVVFSHSKMHGAATSLFIVKHWFLPEFVKLYLQAGNERHINRIAEQKICRIGGGNPETHTQLSFGVDKERPLPLNADVWYAQKFTPEEIRQLASKNLITIKDMPKVKLFSNHP